jgi:hypothetical protein
MSTERFPFDFDPRARALLRLLGVREDNAMVSISDDDFVATFGRWRLATPTSNLKDVRITRDYHWVKAIGPRGSFADGGATFGTNTRAGVCVCFHEPVGALFGPRLMRHPGLTVTVADVDGLAAAVRRRIGVP